MRIVAESKPKYKHTEDVPDPKADKPAKAEECFDAGSSKINIDGKIPIVWKTHMRALKG